MKLVFDIETDGLDASKIWCIVAKDLDTGQIHTYNPDKIQEGLKLLVDSDLLIGHNILGFDIPVIENLTGISFKDKKVIDTLVLSRLAKPERGGHSLKAWGDRIGFPKMEYQGDFSHMTDDLVHYCKQDVRVCEKVYLWLLHTMEKFSHKSVEDEHRMRVVADRVSKNGFRLNRDKTVALFNQLMNEQDRISVGCSNLFPNQVIERFSEKTGKRLKDKVVEFNPASRKQIGERLMELGWKPKVFTDTGLPKVDETTLSSCDLEVAKKLSRYFLLQKRTSQIKSWLELCSDNDRVHCQYRTLGAITNRMSSIKPNLQQVPSVRVEYWA